MIISKEAKRFLSVATSELTVRKSVRNLGKIQTNLLKVHDEIKKNALKYRDQDTDPWLIVAAQDDRVRELEKKLAKSKSTEETPRV